MDNQSTQNSGKKLVLLNFRGNIVSMSPEEFKEFQENQTYKEWDD